MRNWLIEIRQWLAARISRLVKSISAPPSEPKQVSTPPKTAAAPSESIDFQASKLRQSRPIASSLTRQSITIPIPPRPKQQVTEAVISTIPTLESSQLPEPAQSIEASNAAPNPQVETEMGSTDTPEVALAEAESTLAAEGEIAEAEAFANETGESDFAETELAEAGIADAELETEASAGEIAETEADDESDAQPAPTLTEQAAIQATQSEAIFTIRNADDGEIDVQVRGESMSLAAALESLLFVADTSVDVGQFVRLFSLDAEVIQAALLKLGESYKQTGRGIRLQEQNGRYRLISVPAAANLIETFLNLDTTTRLSAPALEALSVIAYRQPVTRAQIEAVRGVDCGYVLRSLLQRGLIEESGRLETVGRPILYSVTEQFMQHFGLTTLGELPPLETTEAALLMQASEVEEVVGQ